MSTNNNMLNADYKYINCGKRGLTQYQRQERRREIAQFWCNNPNVTIEQIADLYNVSVALVHSAVRNHRDYVKPIASCINPAPEYNTDCEERQLYLWSNTTSTENNSCKDKQLYFWWFNCYLLSDKSLDIIADLLNNIHISKICNKYRLTRQRIHQVKMLAQSRGVIFPSKIKTKECVICFDMHDRQAKTCSKKCFKILVRDVRKIAAMDKDLKWSRLVTKTYICIGCNAQFDRSNYHVSIAEAAGCSDPKYCSRQCYWDRNKILVEDVSVDKCPICHAQTKINEPTGMCETCLNEFAQYA